MGLTCSCNDKDDTEQEVRVDPVKKSFLLFRKNFTQNPSSMSTPNQSQQLFRLLVEEKLRPLILLVHWGLWRRMQ
jgi:hypothetical protein